VLALVRRRRWIAALLIALSPALAGAVLPLLHPCPVDAPWLAAAADCSADASAADHGASHQSHQSHQGSSQHGDHHSVCHCPGCGHIAQLVRPAGDAPVTALLHPAPAAPAWPVVERGGDARPILEHLPEATAPPLA
jgi:hypothetical protein